MLGVSGQSIQVKHAGQRYRSEHVLRRAVRSMKPSGLLVGVYLKRLIAKKDLRALRAPTNSHAPRDSIASEHKAVEIAIQTDLQRLGT